MVGTGTAAVLPAAAAGARMFNRRAEVSYAHPSAAGRRGQSVDREMSRLNADSLQLPTRPRSALVAARPPLTREPRHPEQSLKRIPLTARDSSRPSNAFYFSGRRPPADGGGTGALDVAVAGYSARHFGVASERSRVRKFQAVAGERRPTYLLSDYLVASSWDPAVSPQSFPFNFCRACFVPAVRSS